MERSNNGPEKRVILDAKGKPLVTYTFGPVKRPMGFQPPASRKASTYR